MTLCMPYSHASAISFFSYFLALCKNYDDYYTRMEHDDKNEIYAEKQNW